MSLDGIRVDGIRVGMPGEIRADPLWVAAPQVVVTRDVDDQEIVNATADAVVDDEVTVAYTATIPAHPDPAGLKAVWTGAEGEVTTYHEVCDPICTVAQVQSMLVAVGESQASDELVAAARDYAQARIEAECGVSFRSRYARERIDPTDRDWTLLQWPKLQRVLTIDGDVVAAGEPSDIGELRGGPWPSGAEVTYIHGWPQAPGQIIQATARLARHYAITDPSDLDERATSKSNEFAHWTLITPGVRGAAFPIPEVNEAIKPFAFAGGIA